MNQDDPWFIMAMKQMDSFEREPEVYFKALVASGALRDIWKIIYGRAVYSKQLTKLEDLPIETKTAIWTDAKELAGQLLNHNQTIDLSKALLTIKVFAGVL